MCVAGVCGMCAGEKVGRQAKGRHSSMYVLFVTHATSLLTVIRVSVRLDERWER